MIKKYTPEIVIRKEYFRYCLEYISRKVTQKEIRIFLGEILLFYFQKDSLVDVAHRQGKTVVICYPNEKKISRKEKKSPIRIKENVTFEKSFPRL